ncbi:hypothetical protein [Streptomyces sp. I05A-00742]|uniref:hypothetical protein n=1 Tax=Streptomyces sp. I05A-00742 TaxID=2732853 RepID=UPI0014877B87|nr:hypothetical protein [Streptomyces sp. I05A-00742]
MGFLLLILAVGFVLWLVMKNQERERERRARERANEESRRQACLADPSWVGGEFARAAKEGDLEYLAHLVENLPGWPVLQPLAQAAERVAALTGSVTIAERAGVPAEFTADVLRCVDDSAEAIGVVAVKMASLSQHYGHPEWGMLPNPIRLVLDSDAHDLAQLSDTAATLHDSLGMAMCMGRIADAGRLEQARQELNVLARTMQKVLERIRQRQGD